MVCLFVSILTIITLLALIVLYIYYIIVAAFILWHCWLGNRKRIQPLPVIREGSLLGHLAQSGLALEKKNG